MQIIYVLGIVTLGLIFGSFGSVIFFRLGNIPTRKEWRDFFFWRSKCSHCSHELSAVDLIPLRSFFSQKGKCRYCHKKLSRFYPILEIATVLIFLSVHLLYSTFPLSLIITISASIRLLLLILLYDIKKYELHTTATLTITILIVIYQICMNIPLFHILQGSLIFFLLFLFIYYFAKGYMYYQYKQKAEGFWFGDVIFAGVLGTTTVSLFHPHTVIQWMYLICCFLVFACLVGILYYGIMQYLIPPSTSKHKISPPQTKILPFLPGMIIGYIILYYSRNWIQSFFIM